MQAHQQQLPTSSNFTMDKTSLPSRAKWHESQRVSGHDMQEKAVNSTEEKRFLGDHKNIRDFRSSSSSTTSTKVKIKITKKQLKELLGKAEVSELSVQQVLSQLMNVSSDHRSYEPQQQSWRPNLQSIPE
ncbi:hypothetical protein SADUNF_Sadunf11G0101900 [Salix dunnii]|uniref:Uncharacterized protein n=1 Tax=Salix dunnii TaxID=1413687 RepID=A0A835JPP3_9ROSI|nr:hypothetical protein SADUNF_Sadunf11G0101900 [Salix dunnii]